MTLTVGWQIVERGEAVKQAQENEGGENVPAHTTRASKKRSHDDKLG